MQQPVLQHDSAQPYSSARTNAEMWCLGFTFLVHPSYSLKLAPSDFLLFLKLKELVRGQCYRLDDEVRRVVKLWLIHQDAQFSHDRLTKILQLWQKYVDRKGDNVEK